MDFIRLDSADNVVTAASRLPAGHIVETIKTLQPIPSGHKIATAAIPLGGEIRKYAQLIGYASTDIPAGAHVHDHNVSFRNTEASYEFSTDLRPVDLIASEQQDSFMGFRRENGSIGTRNYIAIVTSVNCSATAARMIANAFTPEVLADYPNVDGVAAFVH